MCQLTGDELATDLAHTVLLISLINHHKLTF